MSQPVSRRDIEGKLREIQHEMDTATTTAKPIGLTVGIGVVAGAVGLSYVIGQRKAQRRTTVVEIRRV